MSLSPWRSPLSHALHRNRKPFARYFQLATIDFNGFPANRTVVFRGFFPETNNIKMITDTRSQKYSQIGNQAQAEVCWYFTDTREQFRIAGKLILIDENSSATDFIRERDRTWQDLSDAARSQFAWPEPGQKRDQENDFQPPAPDPNQPPSNFCLLLLEPIRVDHLQLRGNPQNRHIYQCDDLQNWSVQEVNP